jgi:glutaredoxin 3
VSFVIFSKRNWTSRVEAHLDKSRGRFESSLQLDNLSAVGTVDYCPQCQAFVCLVVLLVQLDNLPAGDNIIDIQDALYEVTGARSVPRVFVGGKFIGGGDDTAAKAANGELQQLLVAAGAIKA